MTYEYDNDNIFAKILRGDVPSHTVYETDNVLAFMDIMPRVDGHVLIIPKAPARNLLDISKDNLSFVIEATQLVGKAAMKAFDAQGLLIQQFNEKAAGQEVFHLHFHVLPRQEGIQLRPAGIMAEQELIAKHAELVRAAL